MKAYQVSLINAITLIALGVWGYFASESPSPTAFIPAGLGVILLLLNGGLRKENKTIAHIAVLVTVITLAGLFMPLRGALGRDDTMAIVRVGLMMITTLWAIAAFVRSFIAARKNKEAS